MLRSTAFPFQTDLILSSNLPIGGVAALALALVRIPEQAPKPPFRSFVTAPGLWRKFDLVGTTLLVPAVVMLLLAEW